MRLLLLSDLHIGHKSESQEVALVSLVDAIRSRTEARPIDLVLMAGDLAHSGKQAEYDRLTELLIRPLRDVPEFQNVQIISVPGNHDVDCSVGYPPTIDALGERLDEFFHLNEAGKRLRQYRAESFAAYSSFLRNANVDGVDPLTDPARTFSIEADNFSLEVICVVTSFFSSKDLKKERQTVPAPIHPLRLLLARGNKDATRIVLAHHPKDWFTDETELQLENLLVDNNAVYVHGHEHRIQTNFGTKGLMSIGFGAVYQSSLHERAKPYYRNSFAICQIDDKLHVDVVSWDSENGRWASETQLPAHFNERSNSLPNGRILPLPTSLLRNFTNLASSGSVAVMATVPNLSGCYWLAKNNRQRWLAILREFSITRSTTKAFKPPTHGLQEGHIELRIHEPNGHHLIHAVSAHGDVISYEQIENLNTLFDTEPLAKCTVITLGQFADGAKTLLNRLNGVKSISGIDSNEFTQLWLKHSNSPLVTYARSLEIGSVSIALVVTEAGYALVVTDEVRNQWFHVVGNDGNLVSESDSLVFTLRQAYPSLKRLSYLDPEREVEFPERQQIPKAEDPEFDRIEYLEGCHAVFDDVRYAPLAAVGFRFRSTSLQDLYIPTSANVDGASSSDQGLERAVAEYVESLGLEESLRDQVELHMRSQHGIGRSAEVGAARQLYQRYGNILILGDPGSGKTCFVKYEMLAYCRPPSDSGSWYEQHLPIYVPLAEATDLLRTNDDFLVTCSTIAARRKLKLPPDAIVQSLSDGRAAFFFDGLDEVGRVDERVRLMGKVEEVVTKFAQYGNRFVLASRPVAVQSVDVPKVFTYLHLKGLTDDEIRVLAERVLTTRLGTEEQGSLTNEERELVQRLLEYVNDTTGLRRISRNPLLLTLLVLIYANTGALSARRHVVYTQAVRTLVSYRHRETREQVLPEADLRTQLGRLAYAIYQRQVNELPSRTEVINTLAPDFDVPSSGEVDKPAQVAEFIRRVAEGTGLLVVHPRENSGAGDDDLVSFMHHSFLEYYAAVGFLAKDLGEELPSLVANPQWRDVITLLFGLLSEHRDISAYIQCVLELEPDMEEITNHRLLLAIECAVECDVPPLEAQRLLANNLRQSLISGALSHSDEVRESIAGALDQLVGSAGFEVFECILLQGMCSDDATIAAAFVDFVGRLREPMQFGKDMVIAFENVYSSNDASVLKIACAGALSRRADFRTLVAMEMLEKSFCGGLLERHTALKAVVLVPGLARRFESELVRLLDDPNALIASAAAQCIILGGISSEHVGRSGRNLEKAVSRWRTSHKTLQRSISSEQRAVTLEEQYLRTLLESGDSSNVAFGARILPLANLGDKEIHRLLFATLARHVNHDVRRACLDSMTMRGGVLDLITLADRDYLCELVWAEYRDVRIGALRVLGMLPGDEQIVSILLEFCGFPGVDKSPHRLGEEFDEGFGALAEHARSDSKLRETVLEEVLFLLPRPGAKEFGDRSRQNHIRNVMMVCERIGTIGDVRLSSRFLELAKNFRTPKRLRSQALRVYGRTVRPGSESIRELERIVKRKDVVLREASYAACYSMLMQCGRRVEFVRDVYEDLGRLKLALMEAWKRERGRIVGQVDSIGVGNIRRALGEVEVLLRSYEQYAERVSGSDD